MRRLLWLLPVILAGSFLFVLHNSDAVSTASSRPDRSTLTDYGLAPELNNNIWINTDHPLRLADLRGKVVLLEMWTYDFINCHHVTPTLKQWYHDYSPKGLVIIGNHYPEFSYEADLANLKKAVVENGIQYIVIQDNDGATWQAYHSLYWPTIYLIDKVGHIRYEHIGEGGYEETETAIQDLLSER